MRGLAACACMIIGHVALDCLQQYCAGMIISHVALDHFEEVLSIGSGSDGGSTYDYFGATFSSSRY